MRGARWAAPSMQRLLAIVLLCVTAMPLAGCGGGREGELTVAAAASLRDVLQEIAPRFEAEHPALHLVVSFDASSSLARQIEAGAGFDVFLSADAETLERIADRTRPESTRPLLAGELVVARRADAPALASLAELLDAPGLIAVAGEAVPAGRYARTLLRRRGLWARLAPRVVTASNVRAALALVENGAAEFALVYRTDLARARRARVAWAAGPTAAPVRWYAALLVGAREPGASEFLAFLETEPFRAAARGLGFLDPVPR